MPDRLTAVRSLIERHRTTTLPRFERLWQYFRNPMRVNEAGRGRWYRQAQEMGLPARVSGATLPGFGDRGRREITLFELGHAASHVVEHHEEQPALPGRKPSQETVERRKKKVLDKLAKRLRTTSFSS